MSKVDAAPLRLKLQSLAWLGWSLLELSDLTGVGYGTLSDCRCGRVSHVQRSTERAIGEVFERLCMTENPAPSAHLTRARARNRGWKSPLEIPV